MPAGDCAREQADKAAAAAGAPQRKADGARRRSAAFEAGAKGEELLAAEVISLPMHPYLDADDQGRVIDAVREAVGVRT